MGWGRAMVWHGTTDFGFWIDSRHKTSAELVLLLVLSKTKLVVQL